MVFLLPSVLYGPDKSGYLFHTNCVVESIEYVDTYCPRDNTNDIFDLTYREEWDKCMIIKMNLTTIVNNTEHLCTYFLSGSYQTMEEALIATIKDYQIGTEFPCVLNIIRQVCLQEKHEVIIFAITITISLLLFIASCALAIIFKYYKYICIGKEDGDFISLERDKNGVIVNENEHKDF